jgi:hypothetical protein
MKKRVIVASMLMLGILVVATASVSAYSFDIERKCSGRQQFRVNLGSGFGDSHGYVVLTKGEWARTNAFKITPYAHYVLIYADSNGKVTCINKNQATRNGNIHIAQFEFDYSCLSQDDINGVNGGFAIVPENTVNCVYPMHN